MPGRVGYPTKKNQGDSGAGRAACQARGADAGTPPPKTPQPDQPVKDATGKTWTRYFRNDDGVEWFMEEGNPGFPATP